MLSPPLTLDGFVQYYTTLVFEIGTAWRFCAPSKRFGVSCATITPTLYLKLVAMTGVAPAVVYSPLKRTWNIHSWIFVHRLSLFDYIAIKLVRNDGYAPSVRSPKLRVLLLHQSLF